MNIVYNKRSQKYIEAQDSRTKARIKSAIERIPLGNIRKLRGVTDGYRLRVGDLRVLYTMDGDSIYIDDIGPRGDVYK